MTPRTQAGKNAGIRVRIYNKHIANGEDPTLLSAWDNVVTDILGAGGSGDRSTIRNPFSTLGSNADTKVIDLHMWNAKYKNVQSYVHGRGRVLLKDIVNAYFTEIVTRTPHDTGNAIRNWQVVDSVTGVEAEPYRNFKDDPVDRDEAVDITLALNSEVIDDLVRTSKPRIINPAPYIDILDTGGSQQAPTGMTIHAEAAVNAAWDDWHTQQAVKRTQKKGLLQKAAASRELGSKVRRT